MTSIPFAFLKSSKPVSDILSEMRIFIKNVRATTGGRPYVNVGTGPCAGPILDFNYILLIISATPLSFDSPPRRIAHDFGVNCIYIRLIISATPLPISN